MRSCYDCECSQGRMDPDDEQEPPDDNDFPMDQDDEQKWDDNDDDESDSYQEYPLVVNITMRIGELRLVSNMNPTFGNECGYVSVS